MISQEDKAKAFEALHQSGCFVLPNPWDRGSARILAGIGYKALATTSAGFARSTGVDDYNVTRDMVMSHARELCSATDLPMSADLENGFGHTPEDCAETIRQAAEAGLVGGSIEDFTGEPGKLYDIGLAKERVAAAVEARKNLPFPFILTARAENFFTGTPDLTDAIARLQAYQDAGADCLYAPGLKTLEDIRSVVTSVNKPVNVLLGPSSGHVPIAALAEVGVRRVSVGAVFANLAYGAMIKAAEELHGPGTFDFMGDLPGARLVDLLDKGTPQAG
ncbi:isocitrate lyase/PEP mutase family protein [Henriciella litoralis]|uniref:isocitrate lyase/PEP mutase family protein n=1 Tax=Henriciella litoralis TaxID=568102 RepID=UPI0009FEE134|nr:isocitrate lyase/phosphoenolpyruvate mutase family protein [Henriciella litoralis]